MPAERTDEDLEAVRGASLARWNVMDRAQFVELLMRCATSTARRVCQLDVDVTRRCSPPVHAQLLFCPDLGVSCRRCAPVCEHGFHD